MIKHTLVSAVVDGEWSRNWSCTLLKVGLITLTVGIPNSLMALQCPNLTAIIGGLEVYENTANDIIPCYNTFLFDYHKENILICS